MNTGNQHQMIVKNTYPSGAQEWYCPTCGRHFIIQWPPNYKRIMLDEGDEQASHSGGSGGLVMGSAETHPCEEENTSLVNSSSLEERGDTSDLDDPYLGPWAQWLGNKDL